MLFLIDANVLIRANEDFYPMDRIPQFWEWLQRQGEAGQVKIPAEIADEIGKGPVQDWLKQEDVSAALLLNETVNQIHVQTVFAMGYGENLNDAELEKVGRDPFLVAYALASNDRVVVTKEISKPSKHRGNRKVPDVCNDCGVQWMDDFNLYKVLNFRIV